MDISSISTNYTVANADKSAEQSNSLQSSLKNISSGLQTVDDKAVEKMAATESGKHPSSGCKNGCAGVGNVAPSKVTEKYKRNKYHEVNYCYGEGESL